MIHLRVWCLASILSSIACGPPLHSQTADEHPQGSDRTPMLLHTCLITSDVKRLVDFYEPILNLKAKWSGKDYAEFATGIGVLAIFSAEAQENYIPGSAEAAKNRSLILEFGVVDVDLEYRRLASLVKVWVKPPTTQPWGTRSVYFRDPDGNLVDFYTPAKVH
jgi:catechol 2,3-dioxygenase-like lactoylglutathione lyase family enzyme